MRLTREETCAAIKCIDDAADSRPLTQTEITLREKLILKLASMNLTEITDGPG